MSSVTYLELSDEVSHTHKFYEVTVKDTEVSIRFGRIGERGQIQTKTYPTPSQAEAEANRKIREKTRKGYINTTPSQAISPSQPIKAAQPRPQPVPPPPSTQPAPQPHPPGGSGTGPQRAPLLWQFNSGSQAFGIFISSDYCWMGNQAGRVFRLDLEGQVINQYLLPAGVKCIVEDDIWIYAGCDNGIVYDLTGKLIRLAYELDQKADLLWLDIHDGILAVSDASGGLSKIDPEGEVLWTRLSSGKRAWMVRSDQRGFYHGHALGVTLYDRQEGRQLWHQTTEGNVLFGWQDSNCIYVGTSGKKILALDKITGTIVQEYSCDTSVYCCAAAEDGQYLFAADSAAFIYCFTQSGERLWKLSTGCGSALSMQVGDDRLYLVTSNGVLACIDATLPAIQAAQAGQIPQSVTHQAPSPTAPVLAPALPTTSDQSQGVIVECVRHKGQLRMQVVSPGYHRDWMVQFPRDIREEGARYVVEGLREARQGNFYRSYGDIKKLI